MRDSLRLLPIACLTLLLSSPPASSAESTGPDIAQADLNQLYSDAKSQPVDQSARIAKNEALLASAEKLLKAHPEVPNTALYRELLVRRVMLPAAERNYQDAPTPEHRTQLEQIASTVVSTPVYEAFQLVPEKVHAAQILAKLKIYPTANSRPVEASKHIQDLIKTFPTRPELKEPDALLGQAHVAALELAQQTGEKQLATEYAKIVTGKYVAMEGALDALIDAGQPPVFEAELKTIDGKALKLPDDLKGKVVVLDFWATWCGPCVASLPHIKKLHEAYQHQNVVILGINCDTPRKDETIEANKAKVASFISTKEYNWTHTYEGEWPKCAVKYGINRIPTVFVIGKDGRLLSASARNREEQFIRQALTN